MISSEKGEKVKRAVYEGISNLGWNAGENSTHTHTHTHTHTKDRKEKKILNSSIGLLL